VNIIGATATIYWDDPEETEEVYISFGSEVTDHNGDILTDSHGVPDDEIYFYGSLRDEEKFRNGSEGWTLLHWELHDRTSYDEYRWYEVMFYFDNEYPYKVSIIVNASCSYTAENDATRMLQSEGITVTGARCVILPLSDKGENIF
jgi:hypothetical protein